MKYILIIIYLLISTNIISQTTLFGNNLKGDVKEYKETFYEAIKKGGKFIKGDFKYEDRFVKNQYGEFIKETYFPSENQNKYNNQNQKTETIEYYSDGSIINRTNFTYDNKNNLIEKRFYYASDTLVSRTLFEYRGGLLSKSIEVSFNYENDETYGDRVYEITSNITYKYDKNKNLIEEFYQSDGQTRLEIYKYNNKNYLVEYYIKDSFPDPDSGLELSKRITYIKYDQYNWLQIYFEDSLNTIPKYFYIEREITYN